MQAIDQASFNFSPTIGLAVSAMVGFLVFAVSLDLTWDQFQRVLDQPKAPAIGLLAQYVILPGVAFGIGLLMAATPSVALAIGLAVAFFPALAGVAITCILWGVVHLTVGFAIAATWMRIPIADDLPTPL